MQAESLRSKAQADPASVLQASGRNLQECGITSLSALAQATPGISLKSEGPSQTLNASKSIPSGTEGGGFDRDDDLMANLPLIQDKLALRIVGNPFPPPTGNRAVRGNVEAAPVEASVPGSSGCRSVILRRILRSRPIGPALVAVSALLVAATPAQAQTQPPAAASQTAVPNPQKAVPDVQSATPSIPPAAPAASTGWFSAVTYGAQVDAGITGNFDRPADGLNYGQLFNDKANTVLLNQIQLTVQRPIDSGAAGYDVGFILQTDYGSDTRYAHYLGEFNFLTSSRNQLSVLQADLLLHTPWLANSGIDFKLGQFVTPIGYETIDPSTDPFYSHAYIFNFGPFQHTGLQAIAHVSPTLDLYGQIDTGLYTTFNGGDDNSEPAGLFGFGLNNLAGGKLTVLALTHLGPENATNAFGSRANRAMRYESDVTSTYKATKTLTFILDLSWLRDDLIGANAYGGAGYASYALTPTLTANFRGEIYRDDSGFFVDAYPNNLDAFRALNGLPNTSFTAGRQVYSEWTVGVTYKPAVPHVTLLAFRPEIRWDKSLSSGRPYNDLSSTGSFTLAGDIILGF